MSDVTSRVKQQGRKFHLTRSLVAFERWSSVRDRTNRYTVRHTKYGCMRGMVVGEGGRSTGVLLYNVSMMNSASY